jgi:hypothetical protein
MRVHLRLIAAETRSPGHAFEANSAPPLRRFTVTASKRSTTKKILQALIRGMDPRTGEELVQDTILQRVEVIRALITSLEAVQATEQRASRRSLLPESVGQRWTEDE